jgi:hypothetical protein
MNRIKRTQYFISKNVTWNAGKEALNDVVAQRDKFLDSNSNSIAEIDNEQIQVADVNNGSYIVMVITLTYYPQ